MTSQQETLHRAIDVASPVGTPINRSPYVFQCSLRWALVTVSIWSVDERLPLCHCEARSAEAISVGREKDEIASLRSQ